MIRSTPAAFAAGTRAEDSSVCRWPAARTIECFAITCSTWAVCRVGVPSGFRTCTASAFMPASSRSCCSRAHMGGVAPSGSSARQDRWLSESTVGNQTIFAPPRPAISTATGFTPPTEAFSVMAPRAWASGTTARTSSARSAVGT